MDVVASPIGSVTLGRINIPTDVTEARVNISGLKEYRIGTNYGWLSALIAGKLGDIQ